MLRRRRIFKLVFVSAATFMIWGFASTEIKSVLKNGYDATVERGKSGMLHLITNYPLMTAKPWNENQTDTSKLWQRQEEIEETLQRNLNHPLVKNVHLLVNQPLAEQRLSEQNFHNNYKIVVHRINAFPKYRDLLECANKTLQNELVAITNMDVYLDEGFEMINKTFLVRTNTAYIITRHGRQEKRCNMSGRKGYCGVSHTNSYDTFVFVLTKSLDKSVLEELDYYMHVFGSENRLAWILKNRLKKKLLNPCKYLKAYHNHCVDVHGFERSRINKNGYRSAGASPGGLYP